MVIKMKQVGVCIFCFVVITIHAERQNFTEKILPASENEESGRSTEKRSTQDNLLQPEPSFWDTFAQHKPSESGDGGQERAKQEGTFKNFIGYEAIQNILINALKPKPVVDTADESEKTAPNYGTKAQVLGDLVIKGTETLSRALISAVDVPKKAITKISTGATQALNQLGAYLIGL